MPIYLCVLNDCLYFYKTYKKVQLKYMHVFYVCNQKKKNYFLSQISNMYINRTKYNNFMVPS